VRTQGVKAIKLQEFEPQPAAGAGFRPHLDHRIAIRLRQSLRLWRCALPSRALVHDAADDL
jgi:hypothetical protein